MKINEIQVLTGRSATRAQWQYLFGCQCLAFNRNCLALALLVAAIFADNTDHTIAAYDLAVTTDTFD